MADDSTDTPHNPETVAIADGDKQILLALALRYQGLWEQLDADLKEKKELEERIAATDKEANRVMAAATAFGLNPNLDGWFAPIREAVGREIFDKAMADAGYFVLWDDEPVLTLPQEEPKKPLLEASASIRDLVLERLQIVGKTGAKTSDIRREIESLRKTRLHDKTIGMTLYRLSVDGLARREGRTWFFVPEAKNPGSGVPGLINRDNGKGEEL
jgi:hypothetical protein